MSEQTSSDRRADDVREESAFGGLLPWWIDHYPRVLKEYLTSGEDGLAEIERELRTKAAAQPTGKFSKRDALYLPVSPPPLEWRHQCGRCRFWVDSGPGLPGECMIVGREDDRWGGTSIHEEGWCALFMPPTDEPAFAWLDEQRDPAGADLVRGEYHGRERSRPRFRTRARKTAESDGVGGAYASVGPTVGVETVAEGFAAPVDVAAAPGDDRLFIADQSGRVYLRDGERLRGEPVLDLEPEIVELRTQYDERGLLGLALHPDFPDDDRLFVRYSAPNREGTPEEYDHTEVLSSFRVDGDAADLDSERTLLEVPSPQFNHNAGDLAFGPDGYLYVAMGDGGGECDQGVGHAEGGNGQDVTENLLGGILRIDVEGDPYTVPDDNPLVGEAGRDEYYAWGLRNPWRISFDGEGRLFVADVGQHLFEEINVVEKGGNYGWSVREGFHCLDPENPADPPATCPQENDRGEPFLDPIVEYPHVRGDEVVGCAIVGGAVYEGDAIPELAGRYVFGDWTTSQDKPAGRLFAAEPDPDDGRWRMAELRIDGRPDGRFDRFVRAFGRDRDGELYVLTNETHAPTGATGAVHRLVPGDRLA